jgi:hypothetical protein
MASTDLQPYYGPMAGEDFARSFINANTDEFGKTIEAGRDDSTDIRAVRMQGGNEFNRLVAAGVPPPDALAQVAGKLFYNDPAGMTRAVNPRRSSTPPLPGSAPRFQRNVDPASGRVISYSVLNPDGRVKSTMRAPDLTMPQAAKDERSLIMQQIRGMQSSPMNIPGAANPELDALRNRFLELGTNWQSQAQPAMPVPPASFETQTFTETGPEGMSMRRLPVVRGKDTVESADSVRNMFRAGQITREEAKSRLKKLGFD